MNPAVEIAGNLLIDFKKTLDRDKAIPDSDVQAYIDQEDPKLKPKILKSLVRNYGFYLVKDLSGLCWMPKSETRRKKIVYGKEVLRSEAFDKVKYRYPKFNSPFYKRLVGVYDRYTQALDDPTNSLGIPAINFDDITGKSIRRIKRALNIKSFRKDGIWWWSFPKRTPIAAMQKIHDRKMRILRRSLPHENIPMPQVRLIQVMEEHNLDCPSFIVFEEIGYKRRSVIAAKTALHIVTIRTATMSRWIYPSEEVQNWIYTRLEDGPLPEVELLQEAASSTGWSVDVLQTTRRHLGIRAFYNAGTRYWEIP